MVIYGICQHWLGGDYMGDYTEEDGAQGSECVAPTNLKTW